MNINRRIIEGLLIVYILTFSVIFGFLDKSVGMGLVIVSGSICLAFININKIAEFRGAGFYAKMKEATEQAYASIEQLHKVATYLSKATLYITASYGRWGGGGSILKKISIRDEVIESLQALNVKKEFLGESQKEFNAYILFDHATKIRDAAKWPKSDDLDELFRLKMDSNIAPQVFENAVIANNLNSTEMGEALEDYNFFYEHKKIRRPEIWGKD